MNALPVAVLVSGGGTTLKNLIDRVNNKSLPIDIRLVVSSKPDVGGVKHAQQAGIPVEVVSKRDFSDPLQHRDTVFELIRRSGAELVVMGGYLEHLLIADDFVNRVINIHPSLIPAFSGKGCYGLRVHRAALEYGAKLSGCTVHFVDDEFDHGPIIAQAACPVLPDDTPETLQARVFEVECELLPATIADIAKGKVSVDGRDVRVG